MISRVLHSKPGMKVLRALLLGIFIMPLMACSQLPDEKEIERVFAENKLEKGFGDLFDVEAFRKTNGFQQSDNIYIVEIEYDLVFKKSLGDVLQEISEDPVGPQYGVFGSKFIAYTIKANFGNFSAGDRLHQKEKITLINTEAGWQVDTG